MSHRCLAGFAVLLCLAAAAAGHLPLMQPRLIALVEHSDIVVVAVVGEMQTVRQDSLQTLARVERIVLGTLPSPVMRFRTHTRLRPGGRYLLFVRATQPLEALTRPGEVFEADANDDVLLARLVAELRAAAKSSSPERTRRQCQALVPAVSARSEAIRYQAALELDRLAGATTLTAAEHEQLTKAAVADLVIEPILANILRRDPRPTPSGHQVDSPQAAAENPRAGATTGRGEIERSAPEQP